MNNNKLYEQVLPIYEAHYLNKEVKGNDGSYIGVVVDYNHENGIETLKVRQENKEDNNNIISIPVYDIIS